MTSIEFLSQSAIQAFIRDHEHTDTGKLILNPPELIKGNERLVVDQIVSRRKCKNKLPQWYHTDDVILPPPLSLEQSSTIQTARYKSNLVNGSILYDLTGGMGVDCLEMSKSFDEAHYFERNKIVHDVFVHNYPRLSPDGRIITHHDDSSGFVLNIEPGSHVFIDPARRGKQSERVFGFKDCEPDVLQLLPELKSSAQQILIKASPMVDITQGVKELNNVKEVHVVSLRNDCKELLFLIDPNYSGQPDIVCINLESGQNPFSFTQSEESKSSSELGSAEQVILDPNASILKAGAFRYVGARFGLTKLNANTHLYTAQNPVVDFPGRQFMIVHSNVKPKEIKSLIAGDKINVIAKNFTQSTEALKKRLKVKDGGEQYLLAYKDHTSKPRLDICELIKNDQTEQRP